jgi:glycosyltransferase involved in cell wall biosynthesis
LKILLFTSEIGGTAPGIVFERLLDGLSLHHEITVFTTKIKNRVSDKFKLILVNRISFHPKIEWFINITLGTLIFDKVWSKRVYFSCAKFENDFDIIISFASGDKFVSLYAGQLFKRKFKIPWLVYTTDALPPPFGWSKDDLNNKLLHKIVNDLFVDVDSLIAANDRMLSYQLSLFPQKKIINTNYIYPPSMGVDVLNLNKVEPDNIFLYTGNIYGLRDPRSLINAFVSLLFIHGNSRLIFIGSSFPKDMLNSYSDFVKSRIEKKDYVDNLLPYYAMSTALIDLDADIENDVFISSKIFNYLGINRPIICVTNKTSLTTKLFDNMFSVKICNHSAEEICTAMRFFIDNFNSIEYSERKSKLDLVNIDFSVKQFNEMIKKTLV